MIVRQTATAVGPGITASFKAAGGTEPYTYSVLLGGAGGSINSSTGLYTAPTVLADASKRVDIIVATDATSLSVQSTIKVYDPLLLLCEILQKELGLRDDQVILWDQKFDIPKNFDLYIAVIVAAAKPFGNSVKHESDGSGVNSVQSLNMLAALDINIMSRGPEARDRKEEIVLALTSDYAQNQQIANSFLVSTLTSNFVNLSEVDGPAIPYRFALSVNMQYVFKKTKAVDYYDTFSGVTVVTEH